MEPVPSSLSVSSHFVDFLTFETAGIQVPEGPFPHTPPRNPKCSWYPPFVTCSAHHPNFPSAWQHQETYWKCFDSIRTFSLTGSPVRLEENEFCLLITGLFRPALANRRSEKLLQESKAHDSRLTRLKAKYGSLLYAH